MNLIRGTWTPFGKCGSAQGPDPEVLQLTTSGVGVSKSPKKTTTIYTRKKIDNEGRDEVNEGTMQESDNIVDINDENFDINHADSVNEEPITITENYLGYSKRDRFLRLREALEGDDFDKTEVNLKYGDK